MVSEQWLKDYALRIYRKKSGYSFEKVLALFPRYYTRIVGYYMNLMLEEQQRKIKNITIAAYTAKLLFSKAQQKWDQIVEEDKKLGEITEEKGHEKELYELWQKQVAFSKVVIRAAKQVRLYGEGILDKQLITAADETIEAHQEVIEKLQPILNYLRS